MNLHYVTTAAGIATRLTLNMVWQTNLSIVLRDNCYFWASTMARQLLREDYTADQVEAIILSMFMTLNDALKPQDKKNDSDPKSV